LKACLEDLANAGHSENQSFRITRILDLSNTQRSFSESETTVASTNSRNNATNLTLPIIRVTMATPRSSLMISRNDSFDGTGSLPKSSHCDSRDAWKQLNDDLNQIFPKRSCPHDLRRTSLRSLPSRKSFDDDENESDVYHTVYGGRNNPLTASRALGPFSRIRRISSGSTASASVDGILKQVLERNSSTSSSLTSSLSNLSLTDHPSSSYITFAPVAVSEEPVLLEQCRVIEVIGPVMNAADECTEQTNNCSSS